MKKKIHHVLSLRLKLLGHDVTCSSNSKKAITIFETEVPDLTILDLKLLNVDDYKICRKLRILSQNPILILTNIRTASDCIKGLKMGANEYIRKPVSLKELEVRINSLLFQTNRQLNQTSPTETTIYNYGSLNLDTLKNCVIQNKVKIQLTRLEFRILVLLVSNAGQKITRRFILSKVWGYIPERAVDERVVDVYIARLRSKLEENPQDPKLILTIRGVGYILQDY
jgi:OmpR family response regulator RpaB